MENKSEITNDEKEAMRKQVCESTLEYIREVSDVLFEDNPLLENFCWNQYVNTEHDDGYLYVDIEEVIINQGAYHGDDHWVTKVKEKIIDAMEEIEPWVFEELFGAGRTVIITRDDIESTPFFEY
jgi:phosphosulfolactate synthase (CoM biosynthesis protein A)